MKCLVTGATGFLGTNLVHELVKQGWEVRAHGLPGSNVKYIEQLPIELMYGDVTNPRDMEEVVKLFFMLLVILPGGRKTMSDKGQLMWMEL